MFDVYLNDRRDHLLVVAKGGVIPVAGTSARWRKNRWRKKKRKVVTVSDEIRLAVQRDGYYRRRLGEVRKAIAAHWDPRDCWSIFLMRCTGPGVLRSARLAARRESTFGLACETPLYPFAAVCRPSWRLLHCGVL